MVENFVLESPRKDFSNEIKTPTLNKIPSKKHIPQFRPMQS